MTLTESVWNWSFDDFPEQTIAVSVVGVGPLLDRRLLEWSVAVTDDKPLPVPFSILADVSTRVVPNDY